MSPFRLLPLALCMLVPLSSPTRAERLVMTSADIWENWVYPPGVLHLDEAGSLRPVHIGKDIDPLSAAIVRGAGAAPSTAVRAFDGDPATSWSPPPGTAPKDWWLEIDLGQVFPVQQIRLRFADSAPPLPFFNLSLSKGERFINSANVVVEGTLLYSHSERFAFNEVRDVTIDLDDELVQVLRIEATREMTGAPALAEIQIRAFGDNIAFDLIAKGGTVDVEAAVVAVAGVPSVMFDGDLSTMWRVNPLAKGSSGDSETFGDYRIDLGATYWIDSVWLLGEPLGIPPRVRHYYANFLSYQMQYSDGSLAPDGSLAWQALASIPPDPRYLFAVRNFRHDVPLIAARYLRLIYPTSQGGNIIGGGLSSSDIANTGRLDGLGLVSEFQVYGEGYPARVVLRSPVIDLGSNWNITAIEWEIDAPLGAQFSLRSRTGDHVVEQMRYFDKNGKEVTKRRYEKLIASFRGPIETTLQPGDGWSVWSEEYLRTGIRFRSPSPRRYVQLEAELRANNLQAGIALDALTLIYSRPLAHTAVGEVHPARVEPGEQTDFTYFLRPEFARDSQGFEAIALEASVPLAFRALQIDDATINVEVEETNAGLRLHLPERVAAAERVELDFAATVFQNNTRFRAFLERESGLDTLRQQVDPGDAVPDLAGAGDAVSLPVDGSLLTRLDMGAGIFTPNGDGVNDALAISFDVLKVLDARPIEARVYDLRGQLVRTLRDAAGVAGHYQLTWNGRRDSGAMAPPGLYLFHLQIAGDSATRTLVRSIGLSY
ncbi:MAG: gliding motility-associated C-terminal domain-containing protein [Gemmatimonadota bacterium]|nr:gliding motility-associated C-terminal domain-containing protein [Gemmatimonadota bacterium]